MPHSYDKPTPTPNNNNKPTPPTAEDIAETINANGMRAMYNLRSNWPMILEMYKHQAKGIRAKYMAALEEGFTEHQAMYLSLQPWA